MNLIQKTIFEILQKASSIFNDNQKKCFQYKKSEKLLSKDEKNDQYV